MIERGRGSLINFASIAGWIPILHFGAYSASKFAIVAFTEVLYHENRGRGAHIACVCPSQVATPLVAQATSKPKILETGPAPMKPEKVLDAIGHHVVSRHRRRHSIQRCCQRNVAMPTNSSHLWFQAAI